MSDPSELSREVSQLIAGYIDSVIELELLLLLHGAPERSSTSQEVARELRIDTTWTRAHLDKMVAAGLLARDDLVPPCYRFQPATAELRQAVDALAEAYVQRRVSIISAIASKPIDTIRTFADAFKIRKDPSDG